MPEGDTVHRAAALLDRTLTGRVLLRGELRVPQHATADLAGAGVAGTVARGKHLLTRMELPDDDARLEALTLHTHLRMEGAWRVHRPGQRWRRPAHQARTVLEVDGAVAVGFSLGVVELLPTAAEDDVVGHLGPDLLDPGWDDVHEAEALRRLARDPGRPLVEALLDQRNLAGIGNMYAAELAFVQGRHPLTPVGDVEPATLRRLVRRAHQMLALNVRRPTQATTGDLREPFWVYRRDRAACRRCGTPVAVAMRGPVERERATYWCPTCQPAPAD